MRALYSRVWQLREGALQRVERVLRSGGAEDSQREMFRALSRALLRCTQDKVANVFHAALQVRPACVAVVGGSGLLPGSVAVHAVDAKQRWACCNGRAHWLTRCRNGAC